MSSKIKPNFEHMQACLPFLSQLRTQFFYTYYSYSKR